MVERSVSLDHRASSWSGDTAPIRSGERGVQAMQAVTDPQGRFGHRTGPPAVSERLNRSDHTGSARRRSWAEVERASIPARAVVHVSDREQIIWRYTGQFTNHLLGMRETAGSRCSRCDTGQVGNRAVGSTNGRPPLIGIRIPSTRSVPWSDATAHAAAGARAPETTRTKARRVRASARPFP